MKKAQYRGKKQKGLERFLKRKFEKEHSWFVNDVSRTRELQTRHIGASKVRRRDADTIDWLLDPEK